MSHNTPEIDARRRTVIDTYLHQRFDDGWEKARLFDDQPDSPAAGTFSSRDAAASAWLMGIEADGEDTPFDRADLRHQAAHILDVALSMQANPSPFVMKCAPHAWRHLAPHVEQDRSEALACTDHQGGRAFRQPRPCL